MEQNTLEKASSESIVIHKLWSDFNTVEVPTEKGGHGGGDKRLHDKIFKTPNVEDPFNRSAGLRDGVMSVLMGIAARNSIETGKPVKIETLTDLKPGLKRINKV